MADPKGNDSKPTGPVKPPVLDLKARDTSAAAPDSKPAPDKDPAPSPKPAAASPAAVTPSRFALGAAVTGGVLGLAAAYGLAWFGLWPTPPAAPALADPRLAQFATAIPELETVTQTTQAELATLTQRLGALEAAQPAAPIASALTDLSGVETDIAALRARLDTLASAPAPVPAADSGAVDGLRAELIALTTRLDEVAARLGTAEAGLRSLDTTMSATTAALAQQPSDIGAVLQLPLILSGFESAFASGRPYASELAALRAALPQASIPTALANAASTGLSRPDVIASRFDAVLPAMLAGRPANPDAQWQDGALDWFRSAIALRPTGEIAGDSPEALMSQLEAAMARRDFVTAQSLLARLPAPMLAAADDVPALVASQADAAQFLDSLRAQALTGEIKP